MAQKLSRAKLEFDRLTSTWGEKDREELREMLADSYIDKRLLRKKDNEIVLAVDFTEEAERLADNFGKMRGFSCGFSNIDSLTGGFVNGETTTILAKTSVGKSMLTVNMSNKVALSGKAVLFITLEMSHPQLTSRLVSINGKKTESYYKAASLICYQKSESIEWQSLEPVIANAINEMNIELVVIDHLHYFTRNVEHTADELGIITKEVKRLASAHNVPIVLISHVRKTDDNKPITLNDARSSSFIAQDTDIGLVMNRDLSDPMRIIVTIEKHRNSYIDFNNNAAILLVNGASYTEGLI